MTNHKENEMSKSELLVVTGLSGAGKSVVIQCLEDIGYFCVDNLPPILLPKFVELMEQGNPSLQKVAIAIDLRGKELFKSLVEEIDAIKTVVEAAENYLEMKKEYKKLVNDRDLAVKTYERQAKELNHIGYFLIETLGYTMQEVMVIADTSLEIQDVNRKLKELKKINEEATFEDAREEITKDMYEEYCNKFDDIVLNKDFKKSAIKRKLKELIEEINHYYGDDSTVPKDIFDLVQEINEEIKDLEYKCDEY